MVEHAARHLKFKSYFFVNFYFCNELEINIFFCILQSGIKHKNFNFLFSN